MLKRQVAYILLFAAVWIARSLYTQPVEAGGDAIKKWVYVSTFFGAKADTLASHHTMRWAVNMPGVACKAISGDWPATYYLAPLTAFAIGFIVLCSIARSHLPRHLAVAFAILLFFEPMMHRASTQFQPIAFGFVYLSISFWFALGWLRANNLVALVFSAAFAFLAYAAKAPYVYFLPGLVLFYWFYGGIRSASAVVFSFTCFFIGEWTVFNLLSDAILPLGRISAVVETRNPSHWLRRYNYLDYYLMWTKVSWVDQLASLVTLVMFGVFALKRELRAVPPALVLLSACVCSYHIANTFLIANLDDFMTAQPPEPKYLAITMPFAFLAAVLWCCYPREAINQPWVGRCIVALSVGIGMLHAAFGAGPSYWHNGIQYPEPTAFLYKTNEHYREGAAWLESGNVITTNYQGKAQAIKVFLRPFLRHPDRVAVTKHRQQFLMWIPGAARSEAPQVSKYWFSQEVFVSPAGTVSLQAIGQDIVADGDR